jgi:RNA polymerase sigma-70 factor (ECF subfamily)
LVRWRRSLRQHRKVGDDDLDVVLAAAKAGEEWAASRFYRMLHPQLLHYLRHHAPDVADDLAADTWLGVAAGLTRFHGNGSDFRGWLFTIAHHRVTDHFRARARRPPPVVLDGELESSSENAAELALEHMSTQEAIEALVRHLPSDQAEVVLLRVVADLSIAQVAELMGRSQGAIRILQHRAVRKLAKVWEPGTVTR